MSHQIDFMIQHVFFKGRYFKLKYFDFVCEAFYVLYHFTVPLGSAASAVVTKNLHCSFLDEYDNKYDG